MYTKSFLLATALITLIACNTNQADTPMVLSEHKDSTASANNLMASFTEAWNRDDSAALLNMFTDDVIMMAGETTLSGKKEMAEQWLSWHLPITNNLQVEAIRNSAGGDMAFSAGTWKLDVTVPGEPVTSSSGNYVFVWKKAGGKAWKLAVVNIEDVSGAPSKNKK